MAFHILRRPPSSVSNTIFYIGLVQGYQGKRTQKKTPTKSIQIPVYGATPKTRKKYVSPLSQLPCWTCRGWIPGQKMLFPHRIRETYGETCWSFRMAAKRSRTAISSTNSVQPAHHRSAHSKPGMKMEPGVFPSLPRLQCLLAHLTEQGCDALHEQDLHQSADDLHAITSDDGVAPVQQSEHGILNEKKLAVAAPPCPTHVCNNFTAFTPDSADPQIRSHNDGSPSPVSLEPLPYVCSCSQPPRQRHCR